MKILFLSKDFSYNGGGERMLANLANALCSEHNCAVLSLDYSENNSIYVLSEKITLIKANIKRRKINILTKIDYCKWLLKNKAVIEQYDVIIGVGIICNLVLAVVAKKIAAKTIGWEHFCYSGTPLYQKILRKFLFKNLTSVVILTHQDLQKYKRLNENTKVIYNFTQMQCKEISENKKTKTFLFVGRLSKQKGIKYLKKIMVEFCKRNSDWNFKIIGKGELQTDFLNFVKNNNLENRIVYEEVNSNIQTELEKASCVIMTSVAEGLPMILIEAQTCGVPAISFDTITGPAEIISDGKTGFLIKRYDVSNFVEKMLLIASDKVLMMQKLGKQCFLESVRFKEYEKIKEWKNFLSELLEQDK